MSRREERIYIMSDLTHVKIRGKRTAVAAEKSHYGKKRKHALSKPGTTSPDTYGLSSDRTSRKRDKRIGSGLSRLEKLPTEILQSIFVYAANVDLPLASTHLSCQLANPHLYNDLTDAVVHLLSSIQTSTIDQQLVMHRVMNSRFFTWGFFQGWWLRRLASLKQKGKSFQVDFSNPDTWQWTDFNIFHRVLPPVKLLKAPVTTDKLKFFRFFADFWLYGRPDNDACTGPPFPSQVPSWYLEHENVKQAVQTAIFARSAEMLRSCWQLEVQLETEHLQLAVLDAGCDKEVMKELLRHNALPDVGLSKPNIDLLDPVVWSWAEKARKKDDRNGKWLCDVLRHYSRQPSFRNDDNTRNHEYEEWDAGCEKFWQ